MDQLRPTLLARHLLGLPEMWTAVFGKYGIEQDWTGDLTKAATDETKACKVGLSSFVRAVLQGIGESRSDDVIEKFGRERVEGRKGCDNRGRSCAESDRISSDRSQEPLR
jgi:hypothetical protein